MSGLGPGLAVDLTALDQAVEGRELVDEQGQALGCRPADRVGADACHVGRDAWLLHGLGQDLDGAEAPVLTLVREGAVLPGPEDDLEGLLEPRPALADLDLAGV